MKERIGILKQRSIWLRCFLESICLIAALFVAGASCARAQVDCFGQKTLILSALHGHVYDQSGEPIRGADVSLFFDGKILIFTKTDAYGQFHMQPVKGEYRLQVDASGFRTTSVAIDIREGLFAHVHPSKFWLVLGVGGINGPCSSVTSSLNEFVRMVGKNKRRYKDTEEEYATQK